MERPDPREEAKGAVKQEAEKIRKQTGGKRDEAAAGDKVVDFQKRKGGL